LAVRRHPVPAQSAKRSKGTSALEAYAAAAPGLESVVAGELKALGISPRLETGGVTFRATVDTVARANLWLRTASRVIVRVATFRAQAFHELERLARTVPWERFVRSGATVRFRVTSRKSRLYHTGAIEQRFAEAIEHRLGKVSVVEPAGGAADDDDAPTSSGQLFVIRVVDDAFTVSADTSGALLHQRGYRQAIGKAPLRETLAAAMLIVSDWSAATPLIDPMCGSGTIPIEAALLARRIAPGLQRDFAFLSWPEASASMWDKLREDAAGSALPRSPVAIVGSDRDRGAIAAAIANAERADVAGDIEFSVRAVSVIDAPSAASGHVVTNPPYGVRVGEAQKLRDLYARFGQVLRAKCPGWDLALLSANPRLERELRLGLKERLRTRNGGIPVRLLTANVPESAERQA
jgi:putative N6-adenine-specific DNA methylase